MDRWSREGRRQGALALSAALATAALIVVAAPGSTESPWPALLAFVAFAPLIVALKRLRPRGGAATGFLAGFATNLGLCLWFPGLLARFGDLHPALAVGVTLALMAAQAIPWALWGAVLSWMAARRLSVALVATVTFVALERWAPMIFPHSLGLTQYRLPLLIQVAELGGPSVVTGLLVLTSAALAELLDARLLRRPWPRRVTLAALLALAGTLSFGALRLGSIERARAEGETLRVGLVQPDPIKTGWRRPPDDEGTLLRYQRATAALEGRAGGSLDLVLWPEKGYPLLLRADARRDYPEGNPRRLRRGFSAPLIFGVTTVDPATRRLRNSAARLDRDGSLAVFYDKVELILYSEWLPAWADGWLDGGLRYQPGERLEPTRLEVGPRGTTAPLSVFICFESVFPGHLRALMRRRPRLLINLTDDSWFGATSEPEQHLSQAVFRAVESRRDLIRATASGPSALISASGEVLRRSELNLDGRARSLIVEARLLDGASAYARVGDLFSMACVAAALLTLGLAFRRGRR